jgi:F420H(2)-dependent quinone reductase
MDQPVLERKESMHGLAVYTNPLDETQPRSEAPGRKSEKSDAIRSTVRHTEGIDTDRLVADPQAIDELSPSVIKEFRANQGKVYGPMEGMPIWPLTMTGAKTGRALVRPLCYSHDGERIVVIASYGCALRSPPWYDNLVANPVGDS